MATKKTTKKATTKKVTTKKATAKNPTKKRVTKKDEKAKENTDSITVRGEKIAVAPGCPDFIKRNLLKWHHTSSLPARENFRKTRKNKVKKSDVGNIGNITSALDNLTVS